MCIRDSDEGAVGLRATCLPDLRPAPEYPASCPIQFCAAEPRAGPPGRQDAGARDGDPASGAEVHPSPDLDLLHGEGWKIGTRSMTRLWRAEGLLVPQRRRKRRRISAGTLYIDPAAPWQNGIVESFNGRLRDELLSSELFETLAEARYLVDRWPLHYNHRRSQRGLGKRTPAGFAATCPAVSSLRLATLACTTASRGEESIVSTTRFSQGVDR